jgi:hypothetical protein
MDRRLPAGLGFAGRKPAVQVLRCAAKHRELDKRACGSVRAHRPLHTGARGRIRGLEPGQKRRIVEVWIGQALLGKA